MNTAILLGKLTKDIELKKTSSGLSYCSFSLAVDRTYKDANGNKQTDFINCVAWRNTAEFMAKYFHKGSKVLVGGSIQTRSYDDANGQKRHVTEVIVDEVDFAESANQQAQAPKAPNTNTYVPTAPVAPTAPQPVPASPEQQEDFLKSIENGPELPFEI